MTCCDGCPLTADRIPLTNNTTALVIRRFAQHDQNFCGFDRIETAQTYLAVFAWCLSPDTLHPRRAEAYSGHVSAGTGRLRRAYGANGADLPGAGAQLASRGV